MSCRTAKCHAWALPKHSLHSHCATAWQALCAVMSGLKEAPARLCACTRSILHTTTRAHRQMNSTSQMTRQRRHCCKLRATTPMHLTTTPYQILPDIYITPYIQYHMQGQVNNNFTSKAHGDRCTRCARPYGIVRSHKPQALCVRRPSDAS